MLSSLPLLLRLHPPIPTSNTQGNPGLRWELQASCPLLLWAQRTAPFLPKPLALSGYLIASPLPPQVPSVLLAPAAPLGSSWKMIQEDTNPSPPWSLLTFPAMPHPSHPFSSCLIPSHLSCPEVCPKWHWNWVSKVILELVHQASRTWSSQASP
jgi:hypothetical protein